MEHMEFKNRTELANFLYACLDNSLDIIFEAINIPDDIDSDVLHDCLYQFARISSLNDFEILEGDSEGYYYIAEFKNTDKLAKLQNMIQDAYYEYNCAAEEYYRAATEGPRGWGD
jgi:hypothetical protein